MRRKYKDTDEVKLDVNEISHKHRMWTFFRLAIRISSRVISQLVYTTTIHVKQNWRTTAHACVSFSLSVFLRARFIFLAERRRGNYCIFLWAECNFSRSYDTFQCSHSISKMFSPVSEHLKRNFLCAVHHVKFLHFFWSTNSSFSIWICVFMNLFQAKRRKFRIKLAVGRWQRPKWTIIFVNYEACWV